MEGDDKLIMLTYVDDLIIADNSPRLREKVMKKVHAKWETTDVGELEWCLGIKVERNREKRLATMSQELYIRDTNTKYQGHPLRAGNRTDSPCGEAIRSLKKATPDSTETPKVIDQYRSLIGALLWISLILADPTSPLHVS